MNIPQIIAKELEIKKEQVDAVIKLFQEDATIPFIARYRKEHTGGLDEDFLRQIEDRLNYLTLLEDRRETILKSIDERRKKIADSIYEAQKLREEFEKTLPDSFGRLLPELKTDLKDLAKLYEDTMKTKTPMGRKELEQRRQRLETLKNEDKQSSEQGIKKIHERIKNAA